MTAKNAAVGMFTEPKKTRLNINELIREGKPIWVLNKTADYLRRRGRKAKSGIVVLQIWSGNVFDKVIIPQGPDPVCITDQVDSDALKSCRDLLRSLNVGTLQLLDPDKAEDYYTRNESRRALLEKKVEDQRWKVVEEAMPKEAGESAFHVDPMVTSILLKMKHKQLTEDDAVESLNSNFGGFSENDLEYLSRVPQSEKIREWARAQLDVNHQ